MKQRRLVMGVAAALPFVFVRLVYAALGSVAIRVTLYLPSHISLDIPWYVTN